jgi:hypothetical protein
MKKLLLTFILGILLISCASAYTTSTFIEDDAKKLELNTDTNYGTIILKDRYYLDLLGWFDKDLATLTLKDNTDNCGNDCHAIKDIELFEEGSLVDDVRFYRIYEDGKQELSSIRSYEVLIKTDEKTTIEDVYESVCKETGKININGTAEISCSNVKVGTKEVVEDVWGKYNIGDKKPIGKYTIKLVGEKRAEWSYDWQILSQGYWTEEWSVWGASTTGNMFYDGDSSTSASGNTLGGQLGTGYKFVANKTTLIGTVSAYLIRPVASSNNNRSVGIFTDNAGAPGTLIGSWSNVRHLDPISMPDYVNWTWSANYPSITSGTTYWVVFNLTTASQTGYYRFGETLTTPEVYYITTDWASWGGFDGADVGKLNIKLFEGASSTITLNSPINYYNSSSRNVLFNSSFNIVGATGKNMSIWTNKTGWSRKETQVITGTTNTSIFTYDFVTDGNYLWGIQACDSDNDCGWSENRTVSIDTTAPTISLLYPTGTIPYGYLGQNISLNYSISDTNLGSCWYNYNGTTNVTIPCSANSSLILGTQKSIIMYANDTAGNLNTTSFSWDYTVFETAQTYSTTAYETSIETFYLNLTYNSSATSIVAKLNYDGTNYSSINIGSGDNGSFKAVITIPLLNATANKTFFWYINNVAQDRYNQTVTPITLVFCNATYTTKAINFTYYDEDTLLPITASTNNTKIKTYFNYWVGDGSIKKSYNFQNLSSTSNTFSFCMAPAFLPNINYDLILEYGANGYLDNEYNILAGNLSNSTANISLYLLPTSLGTKFVHTVREGIDSVPNVLVRVSKFFVGLGVYKEIGIRLTDSTGRFTQYLELDKRYKYTIIEDGNSTTDIEINAICAVAPCEITLQIEGATSQILDEIEAYIAQNVNYTLWVNKTTKMVYLDFEDLLGTAQYWRLYVYKPYFGNETHDVICNLTSYSTSGSLSCNYTGYSGDIFARVYISRSPEKLVDFINFLNDDVAPTLGESGLLASIILLLLIIFAGARNPSNALIMIPFGMIILKFIGFMPLPWEAIVGISIVCGIIAFKMKT